MVWCANECSRVCCPPAAAALHVLELVDAALGVPLADLAQRLVLVASLAHVLAVDLVHRRLLGLVARLRQVLFQGLQAIKCMLDTT